MEALPFPIHLLGVYYYLLPSLCTDLLDLKSLLSVPGLLDLNPQLLVPGHESPATQNSFFSNLLHDLQFLLCFHDSRNLSIPVSLQ